MGLFGKMKHHASKLGRKLKKAKKIGKKGLSDASELMDKGAKMAHQGEHILGQVQKGVSKFEKSGIGKAVETYVPASKQILGTVQTTAARGKAGLKLAEGGLHIGSGIAHAGHHGDVKGVMSGIEKAKKYKEEHISVH